VIKKRKKRKGKKKIRKKESKNFTQQPFLGVSITYSLLWK
jgi:hypothetical protein